MDKNLEQVKKIKLNTSNIRSILIQRNKDQKKTILKKRFKNISGLQSMLQENQLRRQLLQ